MNGNGRVIVLEDQKLLRVHGIAERTAINGIFMEHVIREAIGMRGCWKQGTQHGQLETRHPGGFLR